MKLDYPATSRNAEAIERVLSQHLPASGVVLEVASGSGQHALRLATTFSNLTWQPSDPELDARRSIDAYRADANLANLRPALELDAATHPWPVQTAAVVMCVNMVHISPWAATLGLFAGAKHVLDADGLLYLYGPYKRNGAHTAPSNASFDASLMRRNAEWGVRNLEDVVALGEPELELVEVVEMPANNLSVILRRTSK